MSATEFEGNGTVVSNTDSKAEVEFEAKNIPQDEQCHVSQEALNIIVKYILGFVSQDALQEIVYNFTVDEDNLVTEDQVNLLINNAIAQLSLASCDAGTVDFDADGTKQFQLPAGFPNAAAVVMEGTMSGSWELVLNTPDDPLNNAGAIFDITVTGLVPPEEVTFHYSATRC